jgi:hypothetical protein
LAKRRSARWAAAAFIVAAMVARAAPAETAVDQQTWVNATLMGGIGAKIVYFVEVQPRTADGVERLGQLLLRSAAGWKFSERLSVYGGYAHVINPVRNGHDRNEERLFGQVSWTIGTLGGGTLSSRTRIEHRRLNAGDDTGWRVRGMVRYVHPIGDARGPRALVSAEPFVAFNDTDWGARKGFDQVRSFAGLEVPLVGKSTAEVGYLNQAINDPGGRRRVNHVASLALFWRL